MLLADLAFLVFAYYMVYSQGSFVVSRVVGGGLGLVNMWLIIIVLKDMYNFWFAVVVALGIPLFMFLSRVHGGLFLSNF